VSVGSQLRTLKSNPQLAQGLAQFQAMTGVTIDQLAKIFGGKSVLYVRAGTPIPEVTFIEEDVDAKQSVATLDTLVTRLGAQFQATVTNATVAGVQVKQLTIQRFPVYFGVVDGKLILTTSQAGITDLKNGTSKLVDQDAFKKTIDAADLSTGETAGLLYVDVPSAISNLSGLASIAHATMPAEAQANTKNLRGFVLGGHADDDHTGRATAFLGVQPGPAEPATHTTTG
jgi:hypothetical protein